MTPPVDNLHELPCTPDADTMRRFVDTLFANVGVNGLIEVSWTSAKAPHALDAGELFGLDQFDELVAFAAKKNSIPNCNVYVSAGLRSDGSYLHARAADVNVRRVTAVWADFDALGALQAAHGIAEHLDIPPNLVTFTGKEPHLRGQMWWVLDEPTEDLELHRQLVGAIARRMNGDKSVINPSRVMRFIGGVAWPLKAGRALEMTGILEGGGRAMPYTMEELASKLTRAGALEQLKKTPSVFDFNAARATLDLDVLIAKAGESGHWHNSALRATAHLIARGVPLSDVLDRLTPALQQPGYCAEETRRELQIMAEGALRRGMCREAEHGVRPILRLEPGQLPLSVDTAELNLLAVDTGLYQRGDVIVYVAKPLMSVSARADMARPQIIVVMPAALRDVMTRHIRFQKPCRNLDWVDCDCPKTFAETYLSRVGTWKLPTLTGLISSPTLRPDGSILQTEGYDAATGLLFDARGVVFPTVPQSPSRDEALAALGRLNLLLETFPFVNGSRSAALAAILTSLIRRSLPTAPLFAFTAPVAGTGKSMLVDVISMIVTGAPVAVISQGKSEDEFDKRLGAVLIAGHEFVSIDNCEAPLQGELLCQMLTQQSVRVRILGHSKFIEAPTNAMLCATGNNLRLAGDLTRRAIRVTLDPQVERPELRAFTNRPLEDASRNRAEYVIASLTILRAWWTAGRPSPVPPMGSFEDWSTVVRGALVWLGEADPCSTTEDMREDDPRLEMLRSLVANWFQEFGSEAMTANQVIRSRNETLSDVLSLIAGERGELNSGKFGRWLRSNSDRIIDGYKIVRCGDRSGVAVWQVVSVKPLGGSRGSVGSI